MIAHAKEWLWKARLALWPWDMPRKARVTLGLLGSLWGQGNLWALGVLMGAGRLNEELAFGLGFNFLVGLFLIWQMPKSVRTCPACGVKA